MAASMADDSIEAMEDIIVNIEPHVLDLDEDSDNSNIVAASNGIITQSMVDEEILLQQTTEENRATLAENQDGKENEMSIEDRLQQLQLLLGRSQLYTGFLKKKILISQNKNAEKKIKKEKKETKIQEPLRTRSTTANENISTQASEAGTSSAQTPRKPSKQTPGKSNGQTPEQSNGRTPGNLKRGPKKDANTKALKIPKLELKRLEDFSPEELATCTAEASSKTHIKREPSDISAPVLLTGGVMRFYQLEGYDWLKVLYENGINGILGDEMGLGKTIQCISLFAHLIEHGVTGPFLVCAPLSTLPNWVSEFQRFTPKIPVLLYHGYGNERVELRSQFGKLHSFDGFSALPVIITSYEVVMRDCKFLRRYTWKYIVVDEGHRIKNLDCLLIKCLKELRSLNRLLLTGTPLQNNLAELWCLLNFLLPELFDNLRIFESWFEAKNMTEEGSDEQIVAFEQENHILAILHEILSTFLLRRVKSDVELVLPPKRELLVYAPMTPKQQAFYKATVDRTIQFLLGVPKEYEKKIELPKKRIPNLNSNSTTAYVNQNKSRNVEINLLWKSRLMQFRKCVNHPYLIEYPLDVATEEYLIDEELVAVSGKMQVLDILVKKLIENDHKILIFSQMVKMLDIIHDFCYLKKYDFVRLDGSMKLKERQENIKKFNETPDIRLFLISTRAGGLGLNLVAADTVIIYDSDWNPQCDLQAMDRCHRIGQTRPVVVYRLVTENTIDQAIVVRAAAKRKLEKMVIHKDKFKKAIRSETRLSAISASELHELLKSSDHDGVVSGYKKEVFTKEELDMLLDRTFKHKQPFSETSHSRVKVIEEEGTQSSV